MSSSGHPVRVEIGARVDATDGQLGRATRAIIDPLAQAVTHMVVEPHHHTNLARLVPIELVATVEPRHIRLSCSKTEFEQLDNAEEVEFLPNDADPFGYGPDGEMWPYFSLDVDATLRRAGKHTAMYSDRLPLGEVEVRRGDRVHAQDGRIGSVRGLVIDPEDRHVTHVLLEQGHLFGRKQVAIPIGTVARIGDEVEVKLSKDEIGALPEVSVKSWR